MNLESILRHDTLAIDFIGAALVCSAILGWLLRSGWAWRLAVDEPNERSLHLRPIPRCGGWGIVPLVILSCVGSSIGRGAHLLPMAAALSILAVVSWWDDRHGVPARVRFGAQCVAALVALSFGPTLSLPMLAVGLLWLVWGANLFNFMDGANGLSGSMMLTGFATYAVAAGPNALGLAGVSATLAGAALGFLVFNWDPARLFLGDMGSVPAGFAMAALGLYGFLDGIWPVWFTLVVFAPFIADASLTLLRRLIRGERVWQAHREHFYQRLVLTGVTHRNMTLLWLAMMLFSSLLAMLLRAQHGMPLALGLGLELLMLGAVAGMIERRWRAYLKAPV